MGPGYSLMDWIRYTRQTPDLAGNQGILRRVTVEELAKHNKNDDCWLAIYDKVYNVTPYIKFHPGGVEGILGESIASQMVQYIILPLFSRLELMKGAGINATNLFNDVRLYN